MSRVATHEGETNQMNITLQSVRDSLRINSRTIHVNTASLYIYGMSADNDVFTTAEQSFIAGKDGFKTVGVGKGYGIKSAVTDWVIEQGNVDETAYITSSHCKQARMVLAQGTGSVKQGTFEPRWFDMVEVIQPYEVTDADGNVVKDANGNVILKDEVEHEIEWKKDKDGNYLILEALKDGEVTFSVTNGYKKDAKRKADAQRKVDKKKRESTTVLTAYDANGDPVLVKKTVDIVKTVKDNDGKKIPAATKAMLHYKKGINKLIREHNKIAVECGVDSLSLSA